MNTSGQIRLMRRGWTQDKLFVSRSGLINGLERKAAYKRRANLNRPKLEPFMLSKAYGLELEELDVLIVEDNAHMRRLVETILQAFGISKIRDAIDGNDALVRIEAREPNLIISDWEMKGMDGCTFLEELRKVENQPACFIPVIMLTAHGRPQLIRRAFEAGASQFLVKPLTPANLLHRIDWILADKRPFLEEGGRMRQKMSLRIPKAAVAVAEQKVAMGEAWDLDL